MSGSGRAIRGALNSRRDMHFKDVTKRIPELQEAAKGIMEGTGGISPREYRELIDAYKPVEMFDDIPNPATYDEMREALDAPKVPKVGQLHRYPDGYEVDLRLDIPAYKNHGVWAPTIHGNDMETGKRLVLAHEPHARVIDPRFEVDEKKALRVAAGGEKSPFGIIRGSLAQMTDEEAREFMERAMRDPDWRQVGMDPERHPYFYDREDQRPVLEAREVMQMGPLVLAREPRFGDPDDYKYAEGGRARLPGGMGEPETDAMGNVAVPGGGEQYATNRAAKGDRRPYGPKARPPSRLTPYEPSMADRIGQFLMGDGRASPERRSFVEGLVGTGGLAGPDRGLSAIDATPLGWGLDLDDSIRTGDPMEIGMSVAPPIRKAGRAIRQGFAGGGAVKRALKGALGEAKAKPLPEDHPNYGDAEMRADAAQKTNDKNLAMESDQRWTPPDDDPMWWPYRAEVGGFDLKFDDKRGKWHPNRMRSAEELEVQKAIGKAEKEVKAGIGVEEIFPPETVYRQPLRDERLPVEEIGEDTVAMERARQNVAPGSGAEERLVASIERAPEARPWYYTGRMFDDYAEAFDPATAEKKMDQFGSYMGATTSDASPPSNVRMATYHAALANQQRAAGENVFHPSNPPYPYGHARYTSTHRDILQRLGQGDGTQIDSTINPKGAEFAGSISGRSSGAVMDRVMMEDVLQARGPGSSVLQAPEDGTYGVYRGWMEDMTGRLSHKYPDLKPDEVQAMAWAGHNPDKVDQYSKPLVGHISDRVNVTAKVMSMKAGREVSPWEVYYRYITDGIPLLSVAGATAMMSAMEGGMPGTPMIPPEEEGRF